MNLSKFARGLEGRYAIERELGGGGVSRVILATKLALGRRVVSTVVPVRGGATAVERFRREGTTPAQLQLPHIRPESRSLRKRLQFDRQTGTSR